MSTVTRVGAPIWEDPYFPWLSPHTPTSHGVILGVLDRPVAIFSAEGSTAEKGLGSGHHPDGAM